MVTVGSPGLQVPNGGVWSTKWTCQANTGMYIIGGSTEDDIIFYSNFYIYVRTSDWNMGIIRGPTALWDFRASDNGLVTYSGPDWATAFNLMSDEELKRDIKPAKQYGLKEILGIEPISFVRKKDVHPSRKPPHKSKHIQDLSPEEELLAQKQLADMKSKEWDPIEEIGFSAQQIQNVFPQAVLKLEQDEPNSTLGVGIMPLLAALVNAVKELNAKIGD
jgi:hypothetical protein